MVAEYMTIADANFLRAYASVDEARGITDGPAVLRRIADRYAKVSKCGVRFPFSGFQGTCDRPIGHDFGMHRWTNPDTGWQVLWDEPK